MSTGKESTDNVHFSCRHQPTELWTCQTWHNVFVKRMAFKHFWAQVPPGNTIELGLIDVFEAIRDD